MVEFVEWVLINSLFFVFFVVFWFWSRIWVIDYEFVGFYCYLYFEVDSVVFVVVWDGCWELECCFFCFCG